ncbi:tabinhibitin 1-like [Drosophila kikkawai]|uniref:Tabinhibitin 1-like n=1 Tax=Drosophila kikkawai TaxID=30033 RepID=A0ABM4GLS7_DROKI
MEPHYKLILTLCNELRNEVLFLANYPEELPNKNVAKFTIAVTEKNTHVGCTAVRFSKDYYNHFVLTRNLATSNIVGQPVYNPGEKSTSGNKNRYGSAFDYPK